MILIPERPFDIDEVCEHLKRRHARGTTFSIVVVAEGATPKDGGLLTQHQTTDAFGHVRLGGIALELEKEIEERTGLRVAHDDPRPRPARRHAAGVRPRARHPLRRRAVDAITEGDYGKMVALRGTRIERVPLAEALAEPKLVDSELYETAAVFFG